MVMSSLYLSFPQLLDQFEYSSSSSLTDKWYDNSSLNPDYY